MSKTRRRAYLLIAHGTREEEGRAAFFRFVEEFQRAVPDRLVQPAFLELVQPSIPDALESCIAEGAEEVFVIPLMLFPGRHVNQDIPGHIQAAKARYPKVDFHYSGPLAVALWGKGKGSEPQMFELLRAKIARLEDRALTPPV